MEFINIGKTIKVRIGESENCFWKTVRHNEVIELKESHYLNLVPRTTELEIGKIKVQTKQLKKKVDFLKELVCIKGIGKNTAEDINNWGNKEKLLYSIKNNLNLPFRNDVELILRKRFQNV